MMLTRDERTELVELWFNLNFWKSLASRKLEAHAVRCRTLPPNPLLLLIFCETSCRFYWHHLGHIPLFDHFFFWLHVSAHAQRSWCHLNIILCRGDYAAHVCNNFWSCWGEDLYPDPVLPHLAAAHARDCKREDEHRIISYVVTQV